MCDLACLILEYKFYIQCFIDKSGFYMTGHILLSVHTYPSYNVYHDNFIVNEVIWWFLWLTFICKGF